MRLAPRFAPVAITIALLFAAVSADAGYKRINKPNPADPMAVQIYELDNGLRVYLTENQEKPWFHAEISVRAGSKHDPAESTGLAHYLEHMLFKGSRQLGTLDFEKEKPHLDRITQLYEEHFKETDPEKRKAIYAEINKETQASAQYSIPNEMDKVYKALGENGLNAHTWHEETVYNIALPKNRLEQWAVIESQRFEHPVFRLFQPELEIVYEEKNRSLDNKETTLSFAVGKLLFKHHPYGQQTTIGEVEHLKNPSLQNLYRYYETYYVPNNMAITISGAINAKETMRLIDHHFSGWKAKPVPPLKTWEETPIQGVERVTVKYRGEESVMLAFRLPGRNHADAEALKLMDMVLDNSTAGLINLNLNQKQRVRRAGTRPEFNNDYGASYLVGVPKKGQSLKEVEDLLLEQIQLVRKGQFEEWIIPAIINDFKKNRKAALEENESRVSMMRDSFLGFQDWDHSIGEIARMEKLTKADVVRVANQYFGGGYVAGYRVDEQQEVPKIQKPAIDKINIDTTRQSAFAKQVMSMKTREIEPVFVTAGKDYKKDSLVPGVKIYHSRNPLNDLFSLNITIDKGQRHDRRLAVASQLLDKAGTARLSPEELKKEWYKLGTGFGLGSGENETSISISGLDENFEASWNLLLEVVRGPKADPATLEELKKIILVQREDSKKDHRAIGSAVAAFNRYGKDSPMLTALSNEKISALTVDELLGLITELPRYEHTITYTGSLPLPKLKAILAKAYAGQPPLQAAPPYQFLRAATPEQTRVYLFHKEMAQAQVRLEFPDGVYNEANFPQAQLFNDYFSGGMSGIVFQELREARALAYSAGAMYGMGGKKDEQNFMVGAIGSQADKTLDAVEAFVDLLDNLPESKERFSDTLDSLVNQYRTGKIGFREVLGAVRAWERIEVPGDPRKARFEKVRKGSLQDILAFHQAHLKGRPKLISIVGDKAKFSQERLRKFGPVTELTLTDIFAY